MNDDLTDQILDNTTCFKEHARHNKPCSKQECRHWISSSQFQNCTIIAANKGPLTLPPLPSKSAPPLEAPHDDAPHDGHDWDPPGRAGATDPRPLGGVDGRRLGGGGPPRRRWGGEGGGSRRGRCPRSPGRRPRQESGAPAFAGGVH